VVINDMSFNQMTRSFAMAPFVVHDGPSQEVREIFSGSKILIDDAFLSR